MPSYGPVCEYRVSTVLRIRFFFTAARLTMRYVFRYSFVYRMDGRTHLHANGQVVFLDGLIVQRMIDFYVGPRETVVGPLLQVERVELVGLRRGAGHQPVEHGWVAVDSRAAKKRVCVTHEGAALRPADVEVGFVMKAAASAAACDKVELF